MAPFNLDARKVWRRASHQGEGDVTCQRFARTRQSVFAVKLAQRVGRWAVQLEQIFSQCNECWNVGSRVSIRIETRRIEGAHGCKDLRAYLHAHGAVLRNGRGLAIRANRDDADRQASDNYTSRETEISARVS